MFPAKKRLRGVFEDMGCIYYCLSRSLVREKLEMGLENEHGSSLCVGRWVG